MMLTSSRLLRSLLLLSLAAGSAALGVEPAAAGTRLALVIGNGAYRDMGGLPNATNDAQLIATTLRDLDFEVAVSTDLDQNTMKRAIKDFGRRLDEAGQDAVGLFYYAGHGLQVNGANYLIPVEAEIERESDIDIEAVNVDWVLAQMDYAANDLNFLILDACRNNPVVRSFRSGTRGLAQVDAPKGTLIAYATEPGGVAADGVGSNSPYTLALAANMRKPGRAAEEVFRQVRIEVLAATDDQQTPWESSSLTGAFYFNEGTADTELEVASLDPAATPPAAPATPALDQERATAASPRIAEVAFWQSIADADDPALFEAYLRQYPKGEFRELAAWRRDQFGGKAAGEVQILPLAATLYVQERANIREHPAANAELVMTVDPGWALSVTGEVAGSDWYRVALAEDRQAYIWKPLLGAREPGSPAAAPQQADPGPVKIAALAAPAAAPAAAPPAASAGLAGLWRGEYRCQNDRIGFSIDIAAAKTDQLRAVLEFFPTTNSPFVPRGSYTLFGEHSPKDGQVRFRAAAWIDRPVGIQRHDFDGRLEADGRTMSGHILTPGCADFVLSRL
jgi:uncharacterized caspase-like protein